MKEVGFIVAIIGIAIFVTAYVTQQESENPKEKRSKKRLLVVRGVLGFIILIIGIYMIQMNVG